MRILFIAPQPLFEDRGSPIIIYEELKALSNLGYQIDVATFPIGKDVDIPGVRLIRIANPLRFKSIRIGFSLKKIILDLFLLIKTVCLMHKNSYNCVHGVEEGAWIALLYKIWFKVPVIYDMQSSLPEQLREVRFFISGIGRWLALFLENWLLKNADVIFATKGLAPHVLEIIPEKPVWEYTFPSVNFDRQEKKSNVRPDIFKNPTIVYTGNFTSYQGLELLIEAAAHVHLKMNNVNFILVGGTKPETVHLSNLVKQLKLEKTISLYPRVPQTKIADILRQANVLVLPRPRGSNVPLKIYDYLESGRPIVATNIRAHTSILTNQTATLVEPDAKAIAAGLLEALNNIEGTKETAGKAENIAELPSKNSLQKTIKEAYGYAISLRRAKRHN